MGQTAMLTPRAVAERASKATGRKVTDKQVRGVAREYLPAYSKVSHPARQTHGYTAQQAATIVAVFVARSGGKAVARKATIARKAERTRKAATTVAPESQS